MPSVQSVSHPSSFRDPDGHVFLEAKQVRRIVKTEAARQRMQKLMQAPFFQKELGDTVIASRWLDQNLIHERVPVITYPYEWSFEMLKTAALSQLHILKECLKNGFVLKDGSGFNTLYHEGRMVFVDLLSIDTYQSGQIWEGYAQFCRHFLYPLMLQAKNGFLFQDFWRGSLNGLSVDDIHALLGWGALRVPGGFKHILLQKWLASADRSSTKTTKRRPAMPKVALLSFVRNLIKTVTKLQKKGKRSMWSDYAEHNTYATSDQAQKEHFIQGYLEKEKVAQLVDLGCNTGHYTRLAAPCVKRVVAVDYDPHCIDKLFLSLQCDKVLQERVVPMVGNLMNPSPALGWCLEERDSQLTRLKSDGFLALALVHHLCIAENLPLEMFAQFLRAVAPCGVVEWVAKEDPMVQTLLKNRQDIFPDYTWQHFEACLTKHFKIQKNQDVNRGTRKLVWLTHG